MHGRGRRDTGGELTVAGLAAQVAALARRWGAWLDPAPPLRLHVLIDASGVRTWCEPRERNDDETWAMAGKRRTD